MILLIPLLAATAAALPAWENLDRLDQELAAAAQATGAVALPIDRRIKLAHCPQPIVIEPADVQSLAARCVPLGWKIRVRLTGGQALAAAAPAAMQSAPLVRRGDPVTLSVPGSGFAVETSGTAIEDGRAGAVIRVKLEGGNRLISGIVTGPGEISLRGLNNAASRSLSPRMQQSVEEAVQ